MAAKCITCIKYEEEKNVKEGGSPIKSMDTFQFGLYNGKRNFSSPWCWCLSKIKLQSTRRVVVCRDSISRTTEAGAVVIIVLVKEFEIISIL